MKGELKMDVNEYLPLRDVVFNTLRQAILTGEMEPGERLMEIQLANKLGVSRDYNLLHYFLYSAESAEDEADFRPVDYV